MYFEQSHLTPYWEQEYVTPPTFTVPQPLGLPVVVHISWHLVWQRELTSCSVEKTPHTCRNLSIPPLKIVTMTTASIRITTAVTTIRMDTLIPIV